MLIGVTGGIGAGKSKVARLLARFLSCPLFDSDEVCRQLMQPGQIGFVAFTEGSGKKYLDSYGALNRSLLRTDLFLDDKLRCELESILHPLVRRMLQDEAGRCGPDSLLVAEVPLLYESGWQDDFHQIVVVHAPEDVSLSRVMNRDGGDMSGIEKIIDSQMSREEKRKLADHVILNAGDWQETVIQVELLAAALRKLANDLTGSE